MLKVLMKFIEKLTKFLVSFSKILYQISMNIAENYSKVLSFLKIFTHFSSGLYPKFHQNVYRDCIKFLLKSFHNFMKFLPKIPQCKHFSIISPKCTQIYNILF